MRFGARAPTVWRVTRTGLIAQTVLALGLLISYTLLTALGHDASALLAVLVGQAAGAGASQFGKVAAPPGDK